jgi:hypothetical protein
MIVGGIEAARERGRLYRQLLDGLEETGMFFTTAQRGRVVVDDLLEALDELEAERSTRHALQRRCEELQAIVGKAAYDALRTADAA